MTGVLVICWANFSSIRHALAPHYAGRFFIMTKIGKDTASLHSDWVELLVGGNLMGLVSLCLEHGGTWLNQ